MFKIKSPHIRAAAAILLFACAGQALADPAKLDAGLRRAMEREPAQAAHPLARSGEAAKPEMISASIRFSGDVLDSLRARGVKVRSVLGDVATVDIPVAQLAEIAALPQVIRIESSSRPVSRLDRSLVASRADLLRSGTTPANWAGGTGKGVLVGIIDSGLDLAHSDFRNLDGTTRVLEFWDQRTAAAGTPPTGADGQPLYGALCTQAMIDLALGGTANNCNVPDPSGHGTHVGGIAAGNGQATGNGQAGFRFVGVAPEADLFIANSIDKEVKQGDAVLDAVAYMTRRAKALGRPIVINLSLGSYFGSRDGTSSYERGLDNASGPGAILVGSAGNEGDDKIRAVGTIAQGQTANLGFNMPANAIAEKLEFWYDGANQFDITVGCANFTTPVIKAGDSTYVQETACGKITVTSTTAGTTNGDRQILVNLDKGTSNLAVGAWSLSLIGSVVGTNNRFSVISGETNESITFTTNTESVTSEILTDTVSAKRVIGVASYNTRLQWSNASGAYDASTAGKDSGALGDISKFSSRGPRRLCSNSASCPQVMKPDITAPGSFIIAAYTSKPVKAEAATDIETDGVHVALFGTSMAAPHVAGAIALLLQAQPDLTPEDAKRLLATTAQANAFTQAANLPAFTGADVPPGPNHTWGYGLIDIAKAFRTLSRSVLAGPGWHLLGNTLTTPIDVAAVFGDKTTVQTVWKWNVTANSNAGGWEFFAPSLDAAALAAYATSKGYQVMSTIQPGQGYWVNAASAATLPIREGALAALDPTALAPSWSLVATGASVTPSALNAARTAKQLNPLTTLWAWDFASGKWYFYAPSLEANNTLSTYIAGKGYLDFGAGNKKLTQGTGFWVNR